MPAAFSRVLSHALVLTAGTAGGYWLGTHQALETSPDSQITVQAPSLPPAAVAPDPAAEQPAKAPAEARSNPTGLLLVGTLLQTDRSQSRAWLRLENNEETTSYREQERLPGGYQVASIGADNVEVSKNGETYLIRTSSRASADSPTEMPRSETATPSSDTSAVPHKTAPPSGVESGPHFGFGGRSAARRRAHPNAPAKSHSSLGGEAETEASDAPGADENAATTPSELSTPE